MVGIEKKTICLFVIRESDYIFLRNKVFGLRKPFKEKRISVIKAKFLKSV